MSELDPVAVAAVRTLSRLSRAMERSADELSLAHYRVLSAIADGNERASRIAANLALGKPTVSANVDSLVRRGLLTRTPAGDDQRATVLGLTAAGRISLTRVEAAMVARLSELCDVPTLFAALTAGHGTSPERPDLVAAATVTPGRTTGG